ncbi:MAG: 5-(carboxyamino)imidazole ribonucleotide mutase [Fimbriimonadaceae bacterium]|nr:5-(carboxyamino)imidazole ribonucleotide mutase [Fimbriimonadaceae bacterium]
MVLVGVIMGSESDLPTMQAAIDILDSFGVATEIEVVSAHRTPRRMVEYAETARGRGLKVIIAGAGGAAHLPGMTASFTTLPVIGVPINTRALEGKDSLLSILQMPGGIPVATVAIGNALNAGLLAVQILALGDESLGQKLREYRDGLEKKVAEMNTRVARRTNP